MKVSTNHPKISILIPTTGRADIAVFALGSALKQTFKDFEIVIADSGKGDEIESLVKEYNDQRINYFHTPEGGPFIPWDFAELKARGEYILWLDDDNYLLPYALELFAEIAVKTGADIITASHFYYYDNTHPRHFLRNSIGVVPFSGRGSFVDPHDGLKSFYSFLKIGPGHLFPRFHPSATMISRKVTKSARERLGVVVLHDMPSAHPHPVLLAFAKSCYYFDWPVVIVGRLGKSMSQDWSNVVRKRLRRKKFSPNFSPFSGFTKLNARMENFLAVKAKLPDIMADILVDYDTFARKYLEELTFLDGNPTTIIRNWREFFKFLPSLNSTSALNLQKEARKKILLVPFIYIVRRLRLHYVWRIMRGLAVRRKEVVESPLQKFQKGGEFSFRIESARRVSNVADLGDCIQEIIEKTLDKDIREWKFALQDGGN